MSDATKLCDDISSMIPYSVASSTRFKMKEKLLSIKGAVEKLEVEVDTLRNQIEQKDKHIEELNIIKAAGSTNPEVEVISAVLADAKPVETIVTPETKTELVETVQVEEKVAIVDTTPVQ
jgi:hypothetical protein